jgi:hypothetical protein
LPDAVAFCRDIEFACSEGEKEREKMSRVRAFIQEDIPQVAALKWRYLHNGTGSPPPTMESYIRELFFHAPFSEKTLPSLVYENEHGRVVGFMGVLRRRMSSYGKPIEAAVATSLVVDPASRSTMAGLKLVDWFLSGKQDLAITDTANHIAQQIWARLGGRTVALYTMHWSRPLRPTLYAVYAASRLGKGRLSGALALGCKPVCTIVDAIAARLPYSPFRHSPPLICEEELTAETLVACLRDFPASHSLRPEYDAESARWLMDFMGRMNAYGSLRKVLLRNRENKIIGWYLYGLRRGGVAEVVQIGAGHSSIAEVLDHLSYDAWSHGAIALHGRLDSRLSRESLGKYCFYFPGNSLLVHSRDPELTRQIQSGSAFLTRLDGEWCLRFGPQETETRRDTAGYQSGATNIGLTTPHTGQDLKPSTFESPVPLSGGPPRRLNAESR